MSKVVKVSEDTHSKLAGMAKWGESLDQVIRRLATVSKGLEDVVAGTSSICYVDGEKGRLLYRGYDIRDLALKSSYEETAYLLWNGQLPTAHALHEFSRNLATRRAVPKDVMSILQSLPKNCDAMDALKLGVAALGIYDDPMYPLQEKASSIAAKIGTMTAAIHRYKHDWKPVAPREDLSYASNFLSMLTGKEPDEKDARLMDLLFIIHADHELNASTFTARIITSTLSDVYSAVTGAIGALKGPLHGGANEKVVEMTSEIDTANRADKYVTTALANKQKIMGFGHRVYRTMDPRAKILKESVKSLISGDREKEDFQILIRVEDAMKREKNLYPNVDLYSGLAQKHLGIPSYLFTPVFAVGRTPGWLAHILEQYGDNRIIRPRAEYTGSQGAEYVPIARRGGS